MGIYLLRITSILLFVINLTKDLNGLLLNSIHGTRHIDTQVANSHSQFIKMIGLVEKLSEGLVRSFCLSRKAQVKLIEALFPHCYSVGTYKRLEVVPDIILNTLTNIGIVVNDCTIWQYFRLLNKNKLYVSALYVRQLQTNSSVVTFYDNNQKSIGLIHCFVKITGCHCNQEICACFPQHFAIVQKFQPRSMFVAESDNLNCNTSKFLFKCNTTNNFQTVNVQNIINVCVFMNINIQIYIGLPINDAELE